MLENSPYFSSENVIFIIANYNINTVIYNFK